jgi:hypothetical protein
MKALSFEYVQLYMCVHFSIRPVLSINANPYFRHFMFNPPDLQVQPVERATSFEDCCSVSKVFFMKYPLKMFLSAPSTQKFQTHSFRDLTA